MSLSRSRVTFLVPVLLLASTSWTATLAQGESRACPGNLVANGSFANGLVAGQMPKPGMVGLPNPGEVASWSSAYGTPDVALMGCQNDAGFVGMWGNLDPTIGEGLQQNLGPNELVGGTAYVVSLCVRHGNDPTFQSASIFKVRASTGPLTSVLGGFTIHRTPPVSTWQTWTPIDLIWTAPGTSTYPFLTINVENDLNSVLNDGSEISYGHVDNVCIRKLAFKAAAVCQGQPTTFSSNATGGTSWNWNFGDGTTSTQQNPTHTYASGGTYNVTLCVNGTANCVTQPVTVHPPTPVIIGPNNLCNGLTATYSVAAVSGVTYTWTVSNGTIIGSPAGTSVNVTWNPTGGTISVTATNQQGCSSSTSMQVFGCNVGLTDCCQSTKLNATAPPPVQGGSNVYTLTPSLTFPPGTIRVVANVISTEQTFSSASCGTNGSVSSYVVSAAPSSPPGFSPSLPVAFSHEVIWQGFGGGTAAFSFQIQFPPHPGPGCSDTLKFCVKYTFTSSECRSCEIIRCYSIVRKKITWEDDSREGFVNVGTPFTAAVELETPKGMRGPGPLTLGIKPGTGARGARLAGRTTAEVIDGKATFSNLSIDQVGQGYVLVVSGPGLTEPIESDPFDVSRDVQPR